MKFRLLGGGGEGEGILAASLTLTEGTIRTGKGGEQEIEQQGWCDDDTTAVGRYDEVMKEESTSSGLDDSGSGELLDSRSDIDVAQQDLSLQQHQQVETNDLEEGLLPTRRKEEIINCSESSLSGDPESLTEEQQQQQLQLQSSTLSPPTPVPTAPPSNLVVGLIYFGLIVLQIVWAGNVIAARYASQLGVDAQVRNTPSSFIHSFILHNVSFRSYH